MKKMYQTMFAALLLASACGGGKKAGTTPAPDKPAVEAPGDATGGAAYGGHKDPAAAGKDAPNPCSPK